MTNDQIKHMVERFLQWRLPENFNPDCGIHFDADAAKKMNPLNIRYKPVGTNLLSYTQAEQMVRFITEKLPGDAPEPTALTEIQNGREYETMERLMEVAVGGCACDTKSPEISFHALGCPYAACAKAIDELRAKDRRIDAQEVELTRLRAAQQSDSGREEGDG